MIMKIPDGFYNKILLILVEEIQNSLGEKLVGLYLYGSLATGDFDKDISDIDLLAVLKRDLNDFEFNNLQKMHLDFANKYRDWNNRIEVQYLSKKALKTFKTKDSHAAVISPGEKFHTKIIGKHWLINWYIVREKGITIFGPDPKTIIASISTKEFIDSNKEHVKNWANWDKDMKSKKAQSYAILTLCRALYADRFKEHTSKKTAAKWAIKNLPQWSGLINKALRWRYEEKDYKTSKDTYLETEKFVNSIIYLMKKFIFKEYDPKFPDLFQKEVKRFQSVLKDSPDIEHIGSTSVLGLGGKGVIDIAISALSVKKMNEYKNKLVGIGYAFSKEDSTPDRLFLWQDLPYREDGKQRFHVHIILKSSREWRQVLEFRNFLRNNPEYQKKYADMKKRAAKLANGDQEIYKKIKEPLIKKILSMLF